MKKIEAYIRHESLQAIRDHLDNIGLPSMSLSEIKGSGRQKGYTETYRRATTTVFLRPKLKLEIVVDGRDVGRAVDTILQHAHTGRPGDGKVFIVPVEDAIRVRTGQRGDVVLEPHPPSE